MTDDMRNAFEEWFASKRGHGMLGKTPNGGYEWVATSEAAEVWQAVTKKANQWRPIANAPKDGSLFLGATDKGAVQIIKRNKHLHIWVTDDGKESFRTMTYWLPLPPTGTGVNHGQD